MRERANPGLAGQREGARNQDHAGFCGAEMRHFDSQPAASHALRRAAGDLHTHSPSGVCALSSIHCPRVRSLKARFTRGCRLPHLRRSGRPGPQWPLGEWPGDVSPPTEAGGHAPPHCHENEPSQSPASAHGYVGRDAARPYPALFDRAAPARSQPASSQPLICTHGTLMSPPARVFRHK